MKLGMTGSQIGMTDNQKLEFTRFILQYQPSEFHHGDCIGADSECHALVVKHIPQCAIVIHPPIYNNKRAFCKNYDKILPPADYLVRNHDIVDSVDFMIAT